MGALILPHRLQQQPQQAFPLDSSNPLTRGLVGFWLPSGNGFRSALPNVPAATVAAAGAVNAGPKGRRLGASSLAMAATLPNDSRIKPTAAITVLMDGMMTNAAGYTYNFGCENSNDGWGLYCAGGNTAMQAYLRVGAAWAGAALNVNGGQSAQAGFTFDGATFWSVANGARNNSQAISGTITNSTSAIALNAKNGAGASPGNSNAYYFAIWDRALSPAELASFYANPWQIFKAPARRLWRSAAASVGPVTGTAASAEAADTLGAAGTISFPPIAGAANSTERADTLSAAGSAGFVAISGAASSSEAPDTLTGAGAATVNPITGAASASERADSMAATGTALSAINGSVLASELPDILAASALPPAAPGGGGAGSVREVRAFADELDRARKPTKGEKKRRKQAIEAAVLELLPDEPVAVQVAPVIAQIVARELPPATWAPVHGPRPVILPPAVVADVRARVAAWLAEQQFLAELEDEFETELLLLG
jgi:hypothetical protein